MRSMKYNNLKIPVAIISIGLVLMIAVYFLLSIQKEPTVTEHNFTYSVTYKVDGEIKTFNGVYTCRFNGFGDNGVDPLLRYYVGEYKADDSTTSSRRYTIDEKDGYTLDVITLFNDYYLMGDTENESHYDFKDPCLEAKDTEGNQYDESEIPSIFDAEIISWEYPKPIDNSFEFTGFSGLYVVNTGGMLLVGLLTLVLCMIFVRKGQGVVYSTLDIIGIIFNFIVIILILPILFVASCFIQAYPTGPDWIYQFYLCVPPVIPLTVAISISLRRKGYRLGGLIAQLFVILFLAICIIL